MREKLRTLARTGGAWQALGALALASVALSAVTFSGASLTSRSGNPGSAFASGTLTVLNSQNGLALVSINTLRPGTTATGTLTIKNTGNLADTRQLVVKSVVDTPASPGLSSALVLKVVDTTSGLSTLYNSTLTGATAVALGAFAVNQTKSYSVTISMSASASSALQGAQSSFTLSWGAST
jgi:spore coat-associated protein N